MRQIHQELIPTENIQLKRAPFLVYAEGDTQDDNYITEIWLPIEQINHKKSASVR